MCAETFMTKAPAATSTTCALETAAETNASLKHENTRFDLRDAIIFFMVVWRPVASAAEGGKGMKGRRRGVY
jgi:hypothetical protein